MTTDYHAKLYAHELLRRCPTDSVERFTAALMDSQVDLNPHQVDAALFAFRSPLSKGAILADEVGLGKTIEAGIVLSQKWAERKRKILIILPSSLRKQWHQELLEKFYLPSQILEARTFNEAIRNGTRNPFDIPEIVICSYHFARNKADYVREIHWDLVVIDEAHRLRNVYKSDNKIARDLKQALEHAPKILLTATPLQNSLLELYGLVSFVDEHAFGDLKSFRTQFARLSSDDSFDDLKQRLKPICKRTLRRQVLEYIRFTERKAYTQEFIPTKEEEVLYDMVSEYLRRPNLYALPASQRSLMILVLRKLLASSTFAIAGALDTLANKLERRLKEDEELCREDYDLEDDFETYEELADELEVSGEEPPEVLTEEERKAIRKEIDDLRSFFELAMQISQNAKGESLLQALDIGFRMTTDLGGAEKAVIFTESRRTQNYLAKLLSENGYADEFVLFNGANSDPAAREIYAEWRRRFEGTDKVTGSRTADTRAALVDYFRDNAKIMIATEAAAEGINLQFCSLVVNYDLPWNPQRIEQRIGRCHRYGQQHDVVVVNFLNKNNAADQRVYELLSEKFQLFSGVFGASDEVLGSIESGIDFEKRIAEIYQTCRTPEEIQQSFDALQAELSTQISENMRSTRQKLLENFDAEVAEKLNVYKVEATDSLNRYEAFLWETTRHALEGYASFDDKALTFRLNRVPENGIPLGVYTLKRQDLQGHHYRLQHPLARWVLESTSCRNLPAAELVFDYSGSSINISILKDLIGKSGILTAARMTVTALEAEDYIIVAAVTTDGHELDSEQARRLFNLKATVKPIDSVFCDAVKASYVRQKNAILSDISERNAVFFEEEMDKLNRWAEDKRKSLKSTLKDYDDQIADLKKQARMAPNLPEKLALQKKIRSLDKKRDNAWREYDEAAREIERQKDTLIDRIEARLDQEIEEETLFTIQWKLI
ncbi:MAG: DEAD/DEAH box helicase family protein [Deltaproteobacteria bacterium]|nr:DEAD/DEAH box helicase family protein [Deltaproteobacteria bacterium]